MTNETPPEAAPVPPVANRRWLRAVRVLSFPTVLIPGALVLVSAIGFFPFGLIPAAGFVWVVYSLERKLREADPKHGLALAVWVGAATLLFVVGLAAVPTEGFQFWDWKAIAVLGGVALVPISLVASAIHTLRTSAQEPGHSRVLLGGLFQGIIYLVAALIPAAIALPGLMRSRVGANQASAVGSLRTINTSMVTYESTYHNGFASTLKTLGPALKGTSSPSCSAADLLDEVLASGQKSGYVFEFTPGPRVQNPLPGCPAGVKSYTVTARPSKLNETGVVSYFTDDTGVIRWTHEDRAATVKDPPLGS